jgi:hypothetical protein
MARIGSAEITSHLPVTARRYDAEEADIERRFGRDSAVIETDENEQIGRQNHQPAKWESLNIPHSECLSDLLWASQLHRFVYEIDAKHISRA